MKKIKITCANNMTDSTYAHICKGFREKLGYDACFEKIVDDKIIGGFIADLDGKIYDLSISSQIEKMKKQIIG